MAAAARISTISKWVGGSPGGRSNYRLDFALLSSARPASASRLMASERGGISSCWRRQSSTFLHNEVENRNLTEANFIIHPTRRAGATMYDRLH
jgi:hypothetical protein